MLEKLIWISAFMLVGARHPGATVGVVEKEYRSEVSSLIAELASAAAAEKGITFEEAMEDRLVLIHELLHTSLLQLKSSNGGMDGSILSPRRQWRKGNLIHASFIQHGSKS
ncbi:hypothetical protein Dsin_013174 [Dipteronia sinensis]|uniref:Uncharacterized protein n=1 Tax=Dipteronia sinensis TaxID=43782 RepID=A0AAE0E8V8_9ROSI|nr:hypothetical protein Dsin_013174 [Dipteronia sinensis]